MLQADRLREDFVGLAQQRRPKAGSHPKVVQAPVVAAVGRQQQDFQFLENISRIKFIFKSYWLIYSYLV